MMSTYVSILISWNNLSYYFSVRSIDMLLQYNLGQKGTFRLAALNVTARRLPTLVSLLLCHVRARRPTRLRHRHSAPSSCLGS